MLTPASLTVMSSSRCLSSTRLLARQEASTRLAAISFGLLGSLVPSSMTCGGFVRCVIIGSIRRTVVPVLSRCSHSSSIRSVVVGRSSRTVIKLQNYRSFNSVMAQQHPLVLELVASSVRIADRAGSIVRNIMSAGNLGIVDKGINDLQTEADRSVQRCIVASLHKQYPELTIIGEEEMESSDVIPDWIETSQADDVLAHAKQFPATLDAATINDICVWVDPLDGTAEYTQGLLDHVTVLIGIAVNGEAVAGVIHQPYFNYQEGLDAQLGRTIWGIVGLGSFGFEQEPPKLGERIIVTTRSHETEAVRNAIAACEPTQVVKVGGAGHKVLMLIEGKAHAYIFASHGCKKWDTCAPEAVLRAIGGTLTDVHGVGYKYDPSVKHSNTGGVLATTKTQSHDWFLSKMPDEVKASLPS